MAETTTTEYAVIELSVLVRGGVEDAGLTAEGLADDIEAQFPVLEVEATNVRPATEAEWSPHA